MEFRRLDGGYAWLVTFCCFLLQFYAIGITYSFGIILVKLKDDYNSTDTIVSWIGSIQGFMVYFTGVLAAPLIEHYSYRTIAITGSVISACGMLLSAFSPNIYLLYLTYGLLTGLGFGFMYLTSMVAVQHWFDKRRALAAGRILKTLYLIGPDRLINQGYTQRKKGTSTKRAPKRCPKRYCFMHDQSVPQGHCFGATYFFEFMQIS